jgi:heterodisulfide reductase subunit A
MIEGKALVIGGGIAGIQASLDLGEKGVQVYLVEKEPSIGGRMAQLDKTFPTNDCSICILAPKMSDCYEHPNIDVMTYSEVVGLEGSAGSFTAKVLRKARYVDPEKCTGCGKCTEACRLKGKIPNEFDVGLRKRGAIYIPFLQAVPRMATIDKKKCIYLTKGKCGEKFLCKEACERGAIDFEQEDKVVELGVGAVIVATGFDVYMPTDMFEYGYGKHANVVTSMEYERLICASGPTGGHLEVSPTKEHPRKLAFIQCVGSRDFHHNPYCSSVCCMYATKEAMLAREHYPDLESYIFYTDLRAAGKGFEEYVTRAAKEYNVKYIRARPGQISEDQNKKLTLWYEDESSGKAVPLEVDMVVLATTLVPREDSAGLGKVLGLPMDKNGFFEVRDPVTATVETARDGVYIAGYCGGPRDIPESVVQGSAAADKVVELLFRAKG